MRVRTEKAAPDARTRVGVGLASPAAPDPAELPPALPRGVCTPTPLRGRGPGRSAHEEAPVGLRAPLGAGSRPGRPSTPSSPPPGALHVRPLQSTARRAAPAVPRWDLPRSASKHRFAQGSVLSASRPVARTGHLRDVSQHGRHLLPRPVFLPLSLKPDIVSSNSDLCPPTLKAAERAGEPPNAGAGAPRATARSRGSSGPAVPRPVPPPPPGSVLRFSPQDVALPSRVRDLTSAGRREAHSGGPP